MSSLPYWQSRHDPSGDGVGTPDYPSAEPSPTPKESKGEVSMSNFSVGAGTSGDGFACNTATEVAGSDHIGDPGKRRAYDDVDEAIRELSAEIGQLMQG